MGQRFLHLTLTNPFDLHVFYASTATPKLLLNLLCMTHRLSMERAWVELQGKDTDMGEE